MADRMQAAAATIDGVRTALVFDEDVIVPGVVDPLALEEMLQATALLEAAERGLRKAALLQTRAVAARQLGR